LQKNYDVVQAAMRIDQKLNRQLTQASARLHQRKRRTVYTYTVKMVVMNVINN